MDQSMIISILRGFLWFEIGVSIIVVFAFLITDVLWEALKNKGKKDKSCH